MIHVIKGFTKSQNNSPTCILLVSAPKISSMKAYQLRDLSWKNTLVFYKINYCLEDGCLLYCSAL